jgi:uncharacterized protein DUF4403
MMISHHSRWWLSAAALTLGVMACGEKKIDAPPPAVTPEGFSESDSTTQAPPTYASAPVRLDLRLLLAEIEQTIPNHIGSLKDRFLVSSTPKTEIAFEIQRGPIEIKFGPSSMTLTALVAYRGRVWRKVPLTTISASCGTGEKAPLARIQIRTTYSMDSTWRIRTRSRVLKVERATMTDADECHMTFVGIDVTEKVLDAARKAIQSELHVADGRLASVDVRGAVAPVWAALQQPISLRDTTIWLAFHPRQVSVGRVTVRDSIANATVTLLAQPVVVAGPRPSRDSTPLPNISHLEQADTLVATVEGAITYAAANAILRRQLVGRRLWIRGRRVTVRDATMSYIGHRRVSLGVQLSGSVEGRIYFVGTPIYNPATDAVLVPDLTYDISTANLLVQGITWLAGDKLRDDLRRRARLPAGDLLALATGAANQEITRKLADGVELSGAIGAAHAMNVVATPEGLRAEARTGGKLALDIRLERVFANTHIPERPMQGMEVQEDDSD